MNGASVMPGDCIAWTGRLDWQGYGKISHGKRSLFAHRVVYECANGRIPDGLVIDHLCRNKSCVNVAHLEPVTIAVNTLRGTSFSAVNARKTHCIYGHPFTGHNLVIRAGSRQCRICLNRRADDGRKRRRARKAAK